MTRRTTMTATILDADGWPFLVFKGNCQDVANAASLYVLNVANPLGQDPLLDLIETRETDNEEEP